MMTVVGPYLMHMCFDLDFSGTLCMHREQEYSYRNAVAF